MGETDKSSIVAPGDGKAGRSWYLIPIGVWLALLALTLLLVVVTSELGGIAAVIAMLLVTPTKASLVGYYFMDLRHESNTIRNMVLIVLMTLIVFVALLFSDLSNR